MKGNPVLLVAYSVVIISTVVPRTLAADGEDLLTRVVARAADAIVTRKGAQ